MAVFFGGMAIQKDEETLKSGTPHIVVGTPGRILALIRNKKLNLKLLKHFVLDECDKMLEQLGKLTNNHQMTDVLLIIKPFFLDMRRDVQEIFRSTPHGKQVMMFSATLSKDIRPVCKKFMQDVNINVFITKMLVLLHLASTAITTISYYFVNATRYRTFDLDPLRISQPPSCKWLNAYNQTSSAL